MSTELYPGAPTSTRPSLLPKLAVKPWLQDVAPRLVLKRARIIDPASGTILPEERTVVMEGGRIVSVNPASNDDDTDGIDLAGKFLCPGLIDCHVHITAVPGVKTMGEVVRAPDQVVTLRSTYVLKEMLLRGFTTVRDTGGASKPIALAIEEGLIVGPRLFQCGKALSQTGGHGDFSPAISGGTPSTSGCCGHSQSLARVADGVGAVLRATREELKAGADFIKIMIGGGVASETDAIETVQYTASEVQAITTTCKQMGNKHTTAHAYTVDAINHAIDNGVKGIEHGNLIDEKTAQRMAREGIYLTPTLSCYGIMIRPPFEDFLPPECKEKNQQVMQQGLQALRIASDAGVTICYGSDLLTSMHALQTEEFSVRATILPSPEILKHATTNAAKMLRMDGLLGAIAEGAFADMIILNANPLENIRILDRTENHLLGVVKGGRIVEGSLNLDK